MPYINKVYVDIEERKDTPVRAWAGKRYHGHPTGATEESPQSGTDKIDRGQRRERERPETRHALRHAVDESV